MSDLSDVITEFLIESAEGLDAVDRHLLVLEQDGEDAARLAEIFRCVHTIKGTCGFLGFSQLEQVTHAGESLLNQLREGALPWSGEISAALFALVDTVREILAHIRKHRAEGSHDCASVITCLEHLRDPPPAKRKPGRRSRSKSRSATGSPRRRRGAAAAPAADILVDGVGSLGDSTVRVDVGLLDAMLNLVGELVLARNQILQFAPQHPDPGFGVAAQHLNRVTTEMQDRVMRTRLQPIGLVWNKLPRYVRDLAAACGREVRLEMEGAATELDKTIIEAIKDPLTHAIRNAIDHGIEPPEERLEAGKSREGHLRLRAYHEGGQVTIEVTDDGRGVDVGAVKARAVERGIVTANRADALGEREAMHLIFARGFSTADDVTTVSGRGVGMDVVKTNVERIGGAVDVQSALGTGTTLRIKIPLTLAIIPALIVTSGPGRYAIPQASLIELVRIDADGTRGVEHVRDTPVYRLRGRLIPLVFLDRQLHPANETRGAERNQRTIAVVQSEGRPFGLVVDRVTDSSDIVVKPLGRLLQSIQVYAGATILEDGRVALILDVFGLAHRVGVMPLDRQGATASSEGPAPPVGEMQPVLLIRAADGGQMGIPLPLVHRLEEFERAAVERTAGCDVVQYRGSILPLVPLSEILPERRGAKHRTPTPATADRIHVVVFGGDHDPVGLIVDRIVDVSEAPRQGMRSASRDGVSGTIILRDKVTELLDVERLVRGRVGGRVPASAPAVPEAAAHV